MINNINKVLELGCELITITEELVHVNYRHHEFRINRAGTIVLTPVKQINSKFRFAIYNDQLYCNRRINYQRKANIEVAGKLFSIDRIVLTAFGHYVHDEDSLYKWEVKHLDGNLLNNHIDNLRWISRMNNAVERTIKSRGVCIRQLARDNKINESTFQSRIYGKPKRSIQGAINFVDSRKCSCDRGYLIGLSRSTGIGYSVIKHRWAAGDRGDRLVRPVRAHKVH